METMAERRNRMYEEAVAAKKARVQREEAGNGNAVEPVTPRSVKATPAKPETSDSGWGLLGGAVRGLKKHKADIEQAAKESDF